MVFLMRILHTADWHLGRLFHGVHLTQDQHHILTQFIQLAKDYAPDAILIAGDIYDRAVPPPDAVELLDEVLSKLILDLKIPVILIAGNHDSPERVGFGAGVFSAAGLHVAGALSDTPRSVVLGDGDPGGHARLSVDAGPGLHAAIAELAARGHRSFLWIGPAARGEARQRQVAGAVAAVGGRLHHLTVPAPDDAGAVHAAMAGMALPEATAALCWNDQVAIALIALLRERGRRVPDDVAVAGVDDLVATACVPALSTVALPLADLGRRAAELAMAMADDRSAIAAQRGSHQALPGAWRPRGTT